MSFKSKNISLFGYGGTGGTSGTPPSTTDVRFGVDNGAGQLGQIVIPQNYDVRFGVSYDISTTGTLDVSASPNPKIILVKV